MAKKKDGITELTKLLIDAAEHFTPSKYSRLKSVIFALLHGVNYGYDSMDQKFLNDASDIYSFHTTTDKAKSYKLKKVKKNKKANNVIDFKSYSKVSVTHDA